jgi:hypothetical protein
MKSPRLELVTPAVADRLLTKNNKNRYLRDVWVNTLVGRMKRGEWNISTDPIVIGKDGGVYNGQHRLWAVVISDLPQQFYVFRDAEPEAVKYIDAGRSRSLGDLVSIHSLVEGGERADPLACAVVRNFYAIQPGKSIQMDWSPEHFLAAEEKCKAHVSYTLNRIGKRNAELHRLSASPCLVAIARAHANDVPEVTLESFLKTWYTGDPSGIRTTAVDSYVRRVRDKVLHDKFGVGGYAQQDFFYLLVSKAINNFDKGEAPSKIVETTIDPFPLPKGFINILNSALKVVGTNRSARKEQNQILSDIEEKNHEGKK